jgi:Conjugative transposon protein TcpC
VAAWLNQADPEHPETLAAFDPYVTSQDLTGMVPGKLYAARTAAIDATPAGKNYWAVTVAAEVLRSVKGSLRPAGTRYYGVGIGVARGRYIATSLPEQIAPPPTATPPVLWVDQMSAPAPGDPVADTLTQFFAALLTGHGELDRYVDPASGIVPLTPAPYATVAVRAYGQTPFGTGQALAKAQVAGVDPGGHTTVLEYWLDLEQTQGRWEVARLHRAAPIAGPDQQHAGGR